MPGAEGEARSSAVNTEYIHVAGRGVVWDFGEVVDFGRCLARNAGEHDRYFCAIDPETRRDVFVTLQDREPCEGSIEAWEGVNRGPGIFMGGTSLWKDPLSPTSLLDTESRPPSTSLDSIA